MKKIALAAAVVLVLAPRLVQAQASTQVKAQGRVDASARGSSGDGQSSLSADANARIEADLKVARERRLPERPIRERVAEGRAKGASEAQVVAASARTLVELQTSADAMARAGRRDPGQDEIARGAQLVARGYTGAQIEAVARRAPSDRSLVVAFETLTSLQASGTSTGKAVARIEQMLAARASDAQLREVAVNASAGTHAGGAVGNGAGAVGAGAAAGVAGSVGGTAGSAAAGAGAGAAAAGSVGQGAAGVAAGAGAALGGVIKRP